MNVIFLCAGYATRLYPLTENTPKPLLPLADRPLLNYLMDKVTRVEDVKRIFVVTNAKFFNAFVSWQSDFYGRANLDVVNDGTTTNENRLGAIRDIAYVLEQKKVDEDCLVLAGDNIFDFDLAAFARFALAHRPFASLAVFDVKDIELAKKYGLVTLGKEGRITAFLEKPDTPPTTLASTGVYFFPKESLTLIRQYLKNYQGADAPGNYIRWLTAKSQVFAFPFQGTWYDIGDLNSYQEANLSLRRVLKK